MYVQSGKFTVLKCAQGIISEASTVNVNMRSQRGHCDDLTEPSLIGLHSGANTMMKSLGRIDSFMRWDSGDYTDSTMTMLNKVLFSNDHF